MATATPALHKRRRVWISDFWLSQPIYRGAWACLSRLGDYQVDLASDPTMSVDQWLNRTDYDGFILASNRRLHNAIVPRGRPAVGIMWSSEQHPIPYVIPDESAIGQLGAEHLLGLGYRQFAFYGVCTTWSQLRHQAFAQTLAAHGFGAATNAKPSDPEGPPAWDIATDEAFIAEWLRGLKRPIAIMVCDDGLARALANGCLGLDLRIPQDVAILGVNNLETICEINEPSLSSVDSGFERLGYEAAVLLDRMIRGEKVPPQPHAIAPTGVIARQSTAALAHSDPEVVAAMRFIREHACEEIDVDALCRNNAISRRQLERRFVNAIGHTPFEEIRRVRTETAKELLLQTKLRILQIAIRCGYDSDSSFITAFRARVGCTPEAYRKRYSI